MAARIISTVVLLLLAVGGFFGAGPTEANPLNPFGILFLLVSGVVWFAWDFVREAFAATRDGPPLPMIRLGPLILKGMENLRRTPRTRRTSK